MISSAKEPGGSRAPVFILTCSRSGSTLLRFILDTHPDLACPPETSVTGAALHMLRSWDVLERAGAGRARLAENRAALPEEALDAVRRAVDLAYGRYLARRGKPRWCDKSLDNVINTSILTALYPEARFICLYRHCMDVIASGIEMCPWGLSGFGFTPYVAQNPGNSVAAIASYWSDCTQAILDFEQRQPDRCHRVRYEDLVTDAEHVAQGIFSFLNVSSCPGVTTACFEAPHDGHGPGDEKIWFTNSVTAGSVGRGARVPAGLLTKQASDTVNGLLDALGYRTIGPEWNKAQAPIDPRKPDTVRKAQEGIKVPQSPSDHSDATAAAVRDVIGTLREIINAHPDPGAAGVRWPDLAGSRITLAAAEAGHSSTYQWDIPAPSPAASGTRQSSENQLCAGGNGTGGHRATTAGERSMTLTATPATWLAILNRHVNLITELRSGTLRCFRGDARDWTRSPAVHAVGWLLGLGSSSATSDSDRANLTL